VAHEIVFPHDYVILDACCVINLYESGKMSDILTSLQAYIAIADYVYHQEVLRTTEGRLFELQPLIDGGLLAVATFESKVEMITFVNFAASIDDGEATTGAIAVTRNWAIATDDRLSIRFLKQSAPTLPIVSTLDLVKHWVDTTHPHADIVRTTLQNIRNRARYIPYATHPLYRWWATHIGEQG
jgi:hypothetical protein